MHTPQLIDKFLEKMVERNPTGIQQAEDPDFQYSLLVAQREYARSGDRDLADMLIDLLVERTREDGRNLQSIVLNESISIVSKLTPDQIAVLTLVFVIFYTKWANIDSYAALLPHVRQLMPLFSLLPQKQSAYQHLEYLRCCTIQMGEAKIAKLFSEKYPGLFCKGFSHEQLAEIGVNLDDLHQLVIPCLSRNDLLQLNAIDSSTFIDLAGQKGLEPAKVAELIKLQESSLMSYEEVTKLLQTVHPDLATLIDIWDQTTLKHLTLSSVGVAIGHANYRRLSGNGVPLSIWI